MITCPSCNHQNPEGSLQCENCYTPLPASTSCPNCGASVQTDATFCGQCGFNLQAENPISSPSLEETAVGSLPDMSVPDLSIPDMSMEELPPTAEVTKVPDADTGVEMLPETSMSSPIASPWDEEEEDLTIGQPRSMPNIEPTEMMNVAPQVPDLDLEEESEIPDPDSNANMPWEAESPDLDLDLETPPDVPEMGIETGDFEIPAQPEIPEIPEIPVTSAPPTPAPQANIAPPGNMGGATQLQVETASLLHLQSNTNIEIPANLDVVHIGKPNGQIPPDIDVAGFPDSEVVSRVHADIRVEGDAYYIEDVGSSNGTYINHTPLLRGNRHRLRPGDRIALGKGDLVTFIFQLG